MAIESTKLALRPVAMGPDGILSLVDETLTADNSAALVDPSMLSAAEVEYLTLVGDAVSKLNPPTQPPSSPEPDAATETRDGFDYLASLLEYAHEQLGQPLRPVWRPTSVDPAWVLKERTSSVVDDNSNRAVNQALEDSKAGFKDKGLVQLPGTVSRPRSDHKSPHVCCSPVPTRTTAGRLLGAQGVEALLDKLGSIEAVQTLNLNREYSGCMHRAYTLVLHALFHVGPFTGNALGSYGLQALSKPKWVGLKDISLSGTVQCANEQPKWWSAGNNVPRIGSQLTDNFITDDGAEALKSLLESSPGLTRVILSGEWRDVILAANVASPAHMAFGSLCCAGNALGSACFAAIKVALSQCKELHTLDLSSEWHGHSNSVLTANCT